MMTARLDLLPRKSVIYYKTSIRVSIVDIHTIVVAVAINNEGWQN